MAQEEKIEKQSSKMSDRIDLAILEKAAEIHANLRLRGLPIQTEDILIAASAIVKGLIVVSNDSDLLRVEGLSLENW